MDFYSGHNHTYETFSKQKQNLAELLGSSSRIISSLNMNQYEKNLRALEAKVHDDSFKIMVVGTFKNGKSTFINSFLGEDVLPAYSIPCTAVINEVKYGEEKRAILHFCDPLPEQLPSEIPAKAMRHMKQHNMTHIPPLEIPYDEIEDYVVIPMGEDPREAQLTSPYAKVELFWPLELLKNGVEIIDSPGLNEHITRTQVTMDYLTKADAIVMVLNAQAICSQTEMDFIENDLYAQGFEDPFFVVNRFDCIPKRERDMVKRFAGQKLKQFTSFGIGGIHYVSALDALEGKLDGDEARYSNSGMKEFEAQLSDYLTRSKGKAKLAQPARELKRILNEEALFKVIPMQRKLLGTELDDVKKKYENAQPKLLAAQRKKLLLDNKLRLRISQSSNEFRRIASRNVMDVIDSIPIWAEESTPMTKLGINFFQSKQRISAMASEIQSEIQCRLQDNQLQWRKEVLTPLVEEKVAFIFESAEADVAEILAAVDMIEAEITGVPSVNNDIPTWQRVAAAMSGMVIGGVDTAIVGGINGFSGELVKSIALKIGLVLTLNLFGLLNPVTIIAAIVAVLFRNARANDSNATKKVKEAVAEKFAEAIAKSRDSIVDGVADGVNEQFNQVADNVVTAVDIEIREMENQIRGILAEQEKGQANVEKRKAVVDACEEEIKNLSLALDELVFRLVEA